MKFDTSANSLQDLKEQFANEVEAPEEKPTEKEETSFEMKTETRLIENPFGGKPIELVENPTGEQIDHMIGVFNGLKEQIDELSKIKRQIALEMDALTTGDTKTRRLAGDKLAVKITSPADKFNNAKLKELHTKHPKQAATYLRISKVDVNLREYKKLIGTTTGNEELKKFKELLEAANEGPTGTPTVEFEKSKETGDEKQ